MEETPEAPHGEIPPTRSVVAIHEAGHAVVAVLEGKQLTSVSITSTTGLTKVFEPDECGSGDFWQVRLALAGFVADYLSSGDKEPLTHSRMLSGSGGDHPQSDFRRACRIAQQAMKVEPCTDELIKNCLDEAQQEVTVMLLGHWPAVEAVAARLLAEQELGGDEVREIIATAG